MTLYWFRRDLRLHDNHALHQALSQKGPVQCVFIFDRYILDQLTEDDFRLPYIYQQIVKIKQSLQKQGSDLWVFYGKPEEIWQDLLKTHPVAKVFINHDYEPYARERDRKVAQLLNKKKIAFHSYKDQVIFEKSEVLSDSHKTYTVFTPFKNKWLKQLDKSLLQNYNCEIKNFNSNKVKSELISLKDLGFKERADDFFPTRNLSPSLLKKYSKERDFPALEATSHFGIHLRFGTVSVRELVKTALNLKSDVWLSELIWREFFMQILWHFPEVQIRSFRVEYEKIEWRKNANEFKKWCEGKTGYPLVDAGMRQLNATGYMHNRVRMVAASFLTKHLLMHWSLGERYFASKLLDFDLAANNGNWQWTAGTGCDAAPYFRIFNPETQAEKFDSKNEYIKKWLPEFGTAKYPEKMVDHVFARERALTAFRKGLGKTE
jgi:deoxyribodipyrimidine photo-lyase